MASKTNLLFALATVATVMGLSIQHDTEAPTLFTHSKANLTPKCAGAVGQLVSKIEHLAPSIMSAGVMLQSELEEHWKTFEEHYGGDIGRLIEISYSQEKTFKLPLGHVVMNLRDLFENAKIVSEQYKESVFDLSKVAPPLYN